MRPTYAGRSVNAGKNTDELHGGDGDRRKDEGTGSMIEATDAQNDGHAPLQSETSPVQEEQYPGLCRYCGNAAVCTYPRDEVGIWNCDEFLEK